jgi:hypothetical protein
MLTGVVFERDALVLDVFDVDGVDGCTSIVVEVLVVVEVWCGTSLTEEFNCLCNRWLLMIGVLESLTMELVKLREVTLLVEVVRLLLLFGFGVP